VFPESLVMNILQERQFEVLKRPQNVGVFLLKYSPGVLVYFHFVKIAHMKYPITV